MTALFGFEAHSPAEIAERVQNVGVAKARLPLHALVLARNLVPVIAGNLVGGSVLVALVYYVIYRWPLRVTSTLAPSRKASEG